MNGRRLLISFSGGRTSAYMTWYLLSQWPERDEWEKIIVFANTGKEREETLDFIRLCQNHFGWEVHWVSAALNPVKHSNPMPEITEVQGKNNPAKEI